LALVFAASLLDVYIKVMMWSSSRPILLLSVWTTHFTGCNVDGNGGL